MYTPTRFVYHTAPTNNPMVVYTLCHLGAAWTIETDVAKNSAGAVLYAQAATRGMYSTDLATLRVNFGPSHPLATDQTREYNFEADGFVPIKLETSVPVPATRVRTLKHPRAMTTRKIKAGRSINFDKKGLIPDERLPQGDLARVGPPKLGFQLFD